MAFNSLLIYISSNKNINFKKSVQAVERVLSGKCNLACSSEKPGRKMSQLHHLTKVSIKCQGCGRFCLMWIPFVQYEGWCNAWDCRGFPVCLAPESNTVTMATLQFPVSEAVARIYSSLWIRMKMVFQQAIYRWKMKSRPPNSQFYQSDALWFCPFARVKWLVTLKWVSGSCWPLFVKKSYRECDNLKQRSRQGKETNDFFTNSFSATNLPPHPHTHTPSFFFFLTGYQNMLLRVTTSKGESWYLFPSLVKFHCQSGWKLAVFTT